MVLRIVIALPINWFFAHKALAMQRHTWLVSRIWWQWSGNKSWQCAGTAHTTPVLKWPSFTGVDIHSIRTQWNDEWNETFINQYVLNRSHLSKVGMVCRYGGKKPSSFYMITLGKNVRMVNFVVYTMFPWRRQRLMFIDHQYHDRTLLRSPKSCSDGLCRGYGKRKEIPL